MSLSAREQRILDEIDRDLTAAEPRLARALASAQRLTLLRRPLVARGWPGSGVWVAVLVVSLLTGIALLATGLVFGILALAWAGAVMTQGVPAAFGYLYAKSRRRSRTAARG